ncbi:hypothetical protein CYMTET_23736 [Cymbomonas tetramitiformis]|uniref:Uncharacterized protein n=1 Tax=Cymbomonas tetramitiformis TaxID=36881 RepID=A0AAE0FYP2_9CHLO|nr:hypothetical protein CYMTET_23736 [Cymbomonas tetramitiformis]
MFLKHVLIPLVLLGESARAELCADSSCPDAYAVSNKAPWGDYVCGIGLTVGNHATFGESPNVTLCRSHDGDGLADFVFHHSHHSHKRAVEVKGHFEDISRVPLIVIWPSATSPPDLAGWTEAQLQLRGTAPSSPQALMISHVPRRPPGYPDECHLWYSWGDVTTWVLMRQRWVWGHLPTSGPVAAVGEPPAATPCSAKFDCPSEYAIDHGSTFGDYLCGITTEWGYEQPNGEYLPPPLCSLEDCAAGHAPSGAWLAQLAGNFRVWKPEVVIWRSGSQKPDGAKKDQMKLTLGSSTSKSIKVVGVPARPSGWPEVAIWEGHFDCPSDYATAHMSAAGDVLCGMTDKWGYQQKDASYLNPPLCEADVFVSGSTTGYDWLYQVAGTFLSLSDPSWSLEIAIWRSATQAPVGSLGAMRIGDTTTSTLFSLKIMSVPDRPPGWPETCYLWYRWSASGPWKEFDCPSKEALKHEDPNSPKGSPYYICGITTKYGYETERGAHLPPPLCELAGCITQVMSPGAGAWVAQVVGSFSGNVGGALPLIVIWNSSTTGPTGDTFATAMLGLWDFSQNSTSSSLKVNKIPPKPKGWGMTSYIWCSWGDTASWWLLQEWVWPSDRPTHFRSLPVGGADWAGAGAAYVQLERVAPSLHGTHIPAGAEYVDIVNPGTAVYGTYGVNEETNPAGGAARSHSWASPMTFSNASSQAKYWTARGEAAKVLRPKPVFADPVTFLYSTQPVNGDGGYSYHNYNWLLQAPNDPGAFHPESLYGAGFHVGLPAGTTKSGVLFSTGTSQSQYVFGTRASHDGAPVDLGQDTAGVFRDAFVVYPEEPRDKGIAHVAEWLPDNPETRSQGDTDLVIRAADPARPTAVYMEVAIAQGSPFAQFESAGSMSIVVGAVFPGALATGFKTPLEPAVLLGVNGPASAPFKVNVEGDLGGVIMYQILYQQ